MKYCLPLLLTVLAFGQATATMYTTDLNGRRVAAATQQTTRDGKAEFSESINGRKVTLQQTEVRTLSESPTGRTTETITKKYDPNGQLAGTERIVTEEQKSGNKSTVKATISRSDVQGRLVEQERRTIETVTQGSTTTSAVSIARPGLNGAFETTEKRNVVTVTQGSKTQETESVLRPSLYGEFAESVRTVKETQQDAGKSVEATTYYEVGYTGKLQLTKQQTSKITKAADGSEMTEVNIYGLNSDGVARDERGDTKLKEQQLIVRTPGPGGSVTESTSVRRPTLSDQGILGPPVKLSETTCAGKCDIPLPTIR